MTSRILRKEFPHLKEFCDEYLWAPSCYHGYIGTGWEVVEKYIQKNISSKNRRSSRKYNPKKIKALT